MQPRTECDRDLAAVSDRSLLRRLRLGSEDAATQLYLRYARRLQELAQAKCSPDLSPRIDAEDIVQSVFRTFFRRAVRGDYDVPDGEELWKLLLVIGLNKIRAVGAFHRAARRDIRLSVGTHALGEPFEPTSTGDEASLNVLRLAIDEVLEPLSPTHREVLNLRIEGHQVASIASTLNRSKRSIERLLQELTKTLSSLLTEID